MAGSENEEYKFPEHEAHLVHAEIEIPEFDRQTGNKTSVPKVQKYTEKEFKAQQANNGFAGYKVTILHDPSKKGKVTDDIKQQAAGGQSIGDQHNPEYFLKAITGAEGKDVKVSDDSVKDQMRLINKMNKADLQAYYTSIYGEAPEEAVTVADLKVKIQEKLNFLQAEQNEDSPA